jgi:hypothetical protein
MDRLKSYRDIISSVFQEHAQLAQRIRAEKPNDPNCPAETIAICDVQNDNYVLLTVGWQNQAKIHSILAHLRIINEAIRVEWCGVEDLIEDLIEAGIPATVFQSELHSFNSDQSRLTA